MALARQLPFHPISRPLRGIARFAVPVVALAAVTAPSAAYAFEGGPEEPDLERVSPVSDPSLVLTASGPVGSPVSFALRPLAYDKATQGFQYKNNDDGTVSFARGTWPDLSCLQDGASLLETACGYESEGNRITPNAEQKWKFEPASDGLANKLRNVGTDKCLTRSGSDVRTETCAEDVNQNWNPLEGLLQGMPES
ncbi:hypothetical protein [Streptomyces sp. NPDC048637]|uniref:hypothetical protein n=1 Tax=Streptomyces sp. NPDC048637 TaxID=3155636 RepID=UPI00342868BD